MALHKVIVGDKFFIVESANKSSSKAFGRSQIEVSVEDASAADITEYIQGGNEIHKVEAKAEAAADAPAAE